MKSSGRLIDILFGLLSIVPEASDPLDFFFWFLIFKIFIIGFSVKPALVINALF